MAVEGELVITTTKGYGFAFAQFMRAEGWRPAFKRGEWINFSEYFANLNGVRP
jgi:hypothetical protein